MVAQMFDLMYQHEGIGLAANQVDLPYRMFVINVSGDPDIQEEERVFINPVLSGGKGQTEGREGCLSFPGVQAPVVRSETIKIQAYDLSGAEINEVRSDMDARVVQHETDHLDGVMFFDRLSPTHIAEVAPAIDEFVTAFRSQQASGEAASDEAIAARLAELESLRT